MLWYPWSFAQDTAEASSGAVTFTKVENSSQFVREQNLLAHGKNLAALRNVIGNNSMKPILCLL